MPTLQHEPWCSAHTDVAEPCIWEASEFGNVMTDGYGETYARGSMYVSQALDDSEPAVFVEYYTDATRRLGHVELSVSAVRVLLAAFTDAPEATTESLRGLLEELTR